MGRKKKNNGIEEKAVKLWRSGRYKSYSAIARVLRTYPKLVERAVKAEEGKNDV